MLLINKNQSSFQLWKSTQQLIFLMNHFSSYFRNKIKADSPTNILCNSVFKVSQILLTGLKLAVFYICIFFYYVIFTSLKKIQLLTWIAEVIKDTLDYDFLSSLCIVEMKHKDSILLCIAQQSRPWRGKNSDCCHIYVFIFKKIELNCVYINMNFKLIINPKAF